MLAWESDKSAELMFHLRWQICQPINNHLSNMQRIGYEDFQRSVTNLVL